jgi:hypothetical protein
MEREKEDSGGMCSPEKRRQRSLRRRGSREHDAVDLHR